MPAASISFINVIHELISHDFQLHFQLIICRLISLVTSRSQAHNDWSIDKWTSTYKQRQAEDSAQPRFQSRKQATGDVYMHMDTCSEYKPGLTSLSWQSWSTTATVTLMACPGQSQAISKGNQYSSGANWLYAGMPGCFPGVHRWQACVSTRSALHRCGQDPA